MNADKRRGHETALTFLILHDEENECDRYRYICITIFDLQDSA